MKNLFFGAVFIFFAVFCYGQENPRVVVIPLENRSSESLRDDTETLTELLVNFINDTQRLNVIDRGALNAMMTAQRWQMDDWADEEKTAEMGRVLNAQFIVRGTVSTLGTNLIVSARILDINTAQVMGSASVQLANMNEAYGKMGAFARDLTRNMVTAASPDPQRQKTVREQRQREPAEKKAPRETDIDREDKWFYSLFYLGYQFRTGYGRYIDVHNDITYIPLTAGLAFDFCPLPWVTVSINPSFGIDFSGFNFSYAVPLLLRAGYRFDKVDITGNIGYTIGEGFTIGATLGFRPKNKGSFFMELAYTTGYAFDYVITFSLGAKYGIGTRRWL